MDKVITILGTRPEIIRTSRITPKLDKYSNHIIVHTNQNFTTNLKDLFFEELELRQPDIVLDDGLDGGWNSLSHTSFGLGIQLARMFPQMEKVFKDIKPDKVFILGDTNSALCSIIAERMGIPVYHMESANRSFNRKIPEEVNRILIDCISSYNLFYTPLNRHTLLREGCDPNKIFQCGNPTLEILDYYKNKIENSIILEKLNLKSNNYFLVDIHRTENTESPERLLEIIKGLNKIEELFNLPIICSIHPRTQDKLKNLNYTLNKNIDFLDSMGFIDFQKLEKNALVGLTDSGLCSEEYCLYHVPCVIVRNETERPEVVEAGGAIISGINSQKIVESTKLMTKIENKNWTIPDGYQYKNVSERVVNYILGG
jgi:UDP-N-acetylglucosamine 2-epimerase (non-hydrolysing)